MSSNAEKLAPQPTIVAAQIADSLMQLRQDRDRYVAFAFAAADLLLELGADQTIIKATGAAQSMVGRETKSLGGVDPLELVMAVDRGLMRRLLRKITETGRIDPTPLHLTHPSGTSTVALMGGSLVPSMPTRMFLSFTLMPDAAGNLVDAARDPKTGLLTKEALVAAASRVAQETSGRSPKQLTLVNLDGLLGAVRSLQPDRAAMLMDEISASLRALSTGGDTAARLGDEQFGLVAAGDEAGTQKTLLSDVERAVKSAGMGPGSIGARIASVAVSGASLQGDDAIKSIAYTVNQFVKTKGRDFAVDTLEAGLTAALADTVQRFGDLRRVIVEGRFNLVFQPVVSLENRLVHHHEALSRFPGGRSPFETVTFSEEIGLVQELDLAVCKRAIEAIGKTDGLSVAVNLSGRSVQDDGFRQALSELVRTRQDLRPRLLFELTESAAVEDVEDAANFLRWLRRIGYSVCLDDFGAGAAAYSYLRRFDVDFVKIDGPFLKAAVDGARERALIRSICTLCDELKCAVIGEMIEDEAMVQISRSIGIRYGQGYLFGKPSAQVTQVTAERRKGTTISWQ